MTNNQLSTLRVFAGLTPQTGDLPLDQVADAARWAVAEIERLRADLAAAITVRDEAISDAEAHWDNLVVARNDARQLAAALESAEGAIQVALAVHREATK